MALTDLFETSTIIKICYSSEYTAEQLIASNQASEGDIIISRKNIPYGVLHTHGETFHFFDPDMDDMRLTDLFDNRYVKYDDDGNVVVNGQFYATGGINAASGIGVLGPNNTIVPVITIGTTDSGRLFNVKISSDAVISANDINLGPGGGSLNTKLTSLQSLINSKVATTDYQVWQRKVDSSLTADTSDIKWLKEQLQLNFTQDQNRFDFATTNVEALISNLRTIESNIDTLDSSVNTMQKQYDTSITVLQSNIDAANRNLQTQIATVNGTMQVISNDNQALRGLVTDISINTKLQLAQFDASVKSVTSTVNTHATEITAIKKQISDSVTAAAAVTQRLGIIDTSIKNINTQITNINKTEMNLDTSLQILQATVDALSTNDGNIDTAYVDSLVLRTATTLRQETNDAVNNTNTRIDSLITKQSEYLDISTYNAHASVISEALYQNHAEIQEVDSKIRKMSTELGSGIEISLNTLESRINDISSNYVTTTKHTADINAVNTLATDISTKVNTLEATVNNVSTGLNTKINGINTSIGSAYTRLSTLENKVDEYIASGSGNSVDSARIDELERQLSIALVDLNNKIAMLSNA